MGLKPIMKNTKKPNGRPTNARPRLNAKLPSSVAQSQVPHSENRGTDELIPGTRKMGKGDHWGKNGRHQNANLKRGKKLASEKTAIP